MQRLVEEHTKKLSSMKPLKGPCSLKITDVKTGSWRRSRPVVDAEKCKRCGVCVDYCPCGIIEKTESAVAIDYTYCKGCGICEEECPADAIAFVPESDFEKEADGHGTNPGA